MPSDWPPAQALWSPWPELRADLRAALGIVAGLAVTGVPAGLLWWRLAPRADFRITQAGPVAIGSPSQELLAGDDVVLAVVLAVLGLLAGSAAWALRRRRGVTTLVALALGMLAASVTAWRLGELLGPGPTGGQLTDVGARVTTGLDLASPPALAVGSFCAVLAYLVPTLTARTDDLGRPQPGDRPESTAGAGDGSVRPPEETLVDDGPLAAVPPAGGASP